MSREKVIPILLLIIFQIGLLNVIQFIAWPEMVYEPYLMNHGFTIYENITIAHVPLLLFILQVFFKLFTEPILSIKIFTWFLALVTGLSIFWISSQLFKKNKWAYFAWGLYILAQIYYEGNGIWFDHLVAFFGLWSFFFFYKFLFCSSKWQDLIFSGLFLGLAGISKQTAGWLVLPALAGFLIDWRRKKDLFKTIKFGLLFSLSVLLPWVLVAIWLVYKNALADFWFWAIHFGIGILPVATGQIQLPSWQQLIGSGMPFLIIIPFLYLDKKKRLEKLMTSLWCLFGIFGVYPRFERFHFQPAIPLLVIIWTWLFFRRKSRLLAILMILLFVPFWVRFFINNRSSTVRFFEPDVQVATDWLKQNTKPDQRIYVFNTWDHFYALADRLAAVDPVSPTLEWYLEIPGIQEKMIASLKQQENPVIIIFSSDYPPAF